MDDAATSAGERLFRSDEVERATLAIAAEVQAHLANAMQGPFGVAGAQAFGSAPVPGRHADPSTGGQREREPVNLASDVLPQRFIGAGVALTVAYAALGDADGVRVAAALRCAAGALFPNDDEGWTLITRVVARAIEHLEPIVEKDLADPADAAMVMQRQVYAGAESLHRAYVAASTRLQVAALGTRSWRTVTGGIGPGSDSAMTAFGPFLPGLVRFAFFTAVAVHFVRRDDWAWVGAALVGARVDVHRGADGMQGIPTMA